jgi:hypothetical protein
MCGEEGRFEIRTDGRMLLKLVLKAGCEFENWIEVTDGTLQ